MFLSDYLEERIGNLFSGVAMTAPGTVYLALSSADPLDSGAGLVEPNYTGYIRRAISFSVPGPMSGGIGFQNTNRVEFPMSSGASATVTHVAVFDSINGGNMLIYARLNVSKPITASSSPTLLPGEAKFWLTGNGSAEFCSMILNFIRGTGISAIVPYMTLYNGNPETGGAELVGGNFQRKQIVFSAPQQQPGGQSIITNVQPVDLEVATANLGNFDTDAVFDAPTGGKLLLFRTGVQDVYAQGDQISYATGDIQYTIN